MGKLLRESGIEFDRVNYITEPLSKARLTKLVKKTGRPPRELLRKKEAAYKKLGLEDPGASNSKILDAMARHPELLQRPIGRAPGDLKNP